MCGVLSEHDSAWLLVLGRKSEGQREIKSLGLFRLLITMKISLLVGEIFFLDNSTGLQMLRDANFPTGPVALDCEMVGVGADRRSALARASIVAYDGTVLYDVVCRPEDPITDYRTKYSGIRPSDMLRAIPFASVQEQVQRIIKVI